MSKPINLFESLVEDALLSMADGDEQGVLCDAAAMALNDLPAHYASMPFWIASRYT